MILLLNKTSTIIIMRSFDDMLSAGQCLLISSLMLQIRLLLMSNVHRHPRRHAHASLLISNCANKRQHPTLMNPQCACKPPLPCLLLNHLKTRGSLKAVFSCAMYFNRGSRPCPVVALVGKYAGETFETEAIALLNAAMLWEGGSRPGWCMSVFV